MAIMGRTRRTMLVSAFGIAALAGAAPGGAYTTIRYVDAEMTMAAPEATASRHASARRLLELAVRRQPDALSKAVSLAKQGTVVQARALHSDEAAVFPNPLHASPSQAATALAALYGLIPDPVELARLDENPVPTRDALTQLIDAFASAHSAALTAASPRGGFAAVFAARSRMLDAVVALREAIEPGVASTGPCNPVSVPPALSIDLGGCNDTYTENIALLVDVAGNDVYFNNAGGSGMLGACSDALPFPDPRGSGALIDLSGDDTFGNPASPRGCGTNGGGYYGTGFLLDGAGNDSYTSASKATNGGSFVGAGFLLDAAGSDRYVAEDFGANGGGAGGAGFLLDAAGSDRYIAGDFGTNGGATFGLLSPYASVGFLLDAAGHDDYSAGSFGTNGGGFKGVGFLLDAAGDDAYAGQWYGTNGGGSGSGRGPGGIETPYGFGLLVDFEGTDSYLEPDAGGREDCTLAPKGTFGAQIDLPQTAC